MTVIDSQNLSTGHGHAVMEAAVMKERGAPAEDIVKHVKEIIPKIRASFVLDRLDYLYKGGRCSGDKSQVLSAEMRMDPDIEKPP